MSDLPTRRQLLATAQRHQAEMEQALGDLKRAARRPFAIGGRVGEEIGAHPLPWLAASLLIGVWLGSRAK
jgi:hypothetical protein